MSVIHRARRHRTRSPTADQRIDAAGVRSILPDDACPPSAWRWHSSHEVRLSVIQHALDNAEAARAHLETTLQINPLGIPYVTADDSRILDQLLANR
jgi:hypothetical protein